MVDSITHPHMRYKWVYVAFFTITNLTAYLIHLILSNRDKYKLEMEFFGCEELFKRLDQEGPFPLTPSGLMIEPKAF